MGIVNDFIVDSKQHCFICLAEISQTATHPSISSIKVESGSQYFQSQSQSVHNSSIHSIQYLSRYIKVDVLKVCNRDDDDDDDDVITPHLLDKVKRSRLKVELCEECAHLNYTFSQRFQQLEKLEMELGFSLNRILDKLVEAKKLGREEKFQKLNDSSERSGISSLTSWKRKLEIMKALRTDVMEKSSDKLAKIRPRVYIPAPNIRSKTPMNKLKCGHSSRSGNKHAILQGSGLSLKRKFGKFNLNNGVTSRARNETMKPLSTSQDYQPTEALPEDTTSISSFVTSSSSSRHTVKDYVCGICKMSFKFPGHLQSHSRRVHNKTIHKSFLWKPFPGTKPKYTCSRCGSLFIGQTEFQQHLQSTHANELGHVCKHCGLKFGTRIQLKKHRRLEHNRKLPMSEVITPDDINNIQKNYSAAAVNVPVCEAVPKLERVETRIVKMEPNDEHVNVLPLSFNAHDENGVRRGNITASSSSAFNEECMETNVPETKCDICHLMVTDISTHLYTAHFEQSEN